MRAEMWLKIGQLIGFALMAGGVAMFVMNNKQGFTELLVFGAVVYSVCRIAVWLRSK